MPLPDRPPLRTRVFADGAHLDEMLALAHDPLIAGFTTNPTLMRKSGVSDYAAFARTVLDACADKPVSFEVLSDDFEEMERQARIIASWADNVYVKVPITNTRGESSTKLIERLSADGVKVNVTAIMTLAQVRSAADAMEASPGGVVSVFAGRLADSGRDPIPVMRAALALLEPQPRLELLWASPREVLNVVQADEIGCHIITITRDLMAKLPLLGKDPDEFSIETVSMFHSDAQAAGLTL